MKNVPTEGPIALPTLLTIELNPLYLATFSLGAIFDTMELMPGEDRFSPIVIIIMSIMKAGKNNGG